MPCTAMHSVSASAKTLTFRPTEYVPSERRREGRTKDPASRPKKEEKQGEEGREGERDRDHSIEENVTRRRDGVIARRGCRVQLEAGYVESDYSSRALEVLAFADIVELLGQGIFHSRTRAR